MGYTCILIKSTKPTRTLLYILQGQAGQLRWIETDPNLIILYYHQLESNVNRLMALLNFS